jgi:probable rRNA maturation factor
MKKVRLKNLKKGIKIEEDKLKALALQVLEEEKFAQPIELDVTIVDDTYIKNLNKKYKKREYPTDVLCFEIVTEFPKKVLLGDIYISIDRAKEQAEEIGDDLNRELARLLIHGILHLLGYKHKNMSTKENYYMSTL